MAKKKLSTISFADLTGGKKRKKELSKKKIKKAAKFHLQEMKISKKDFAKIYDDYNDQKSLKKARLSYRREHANELADILLSGRLKDSSKYDYKIQEYIQDGVLFDPEKKSDLKKISKKCPALFAYAHVMDQFDTDTVKSVMGAKVKRLSNVVDEKTAAKIAPLAPKSNTAKVLRLILRSATEKDSNTFSAKEFFNTIKPKMVTKSEWKAIIVQTTLGLRGSSNNAIKDIISYSLDLLADMPKDAARKILSRYADNIQKVAQSGEKLNFLVTLKDLTDHPRLEKILDKNPNIASKIAQV